MPIYGNQGLTKTGAGTLVLGATNTYGTAYTQITAVDNGILQYGIANAIPSAPPKAA